MRTGGSGMSKPAVKLWTRDFVFIILINFLVFLNHIMLLSTFPFYIQSLGGNEALAGLAATLFSLIAVVCRPFIGWMLDNGKRKAILVVGICGLILMPVGYMCVSVLFLAFVCRMVHGASLACSNTSTSTIATDIIPKQRFAEGMLLPDKTVAVYLAEPISDTAAVICTGIVFAKEFRKAIKKLDEGPHDN